MRSIGSDAAWLVPVSDGLASIEAITDFVAVHATENTLVAIDAPLIIRDAEGQRPYETEIARQFGRYKASAHTSNLTLYPDPGRESTRLLSGFAEARALSDALRHAFEWSRDVSRDVEEGAAAHREGRAPRFTGR